MATDQQALRVMPMALTDDSLLLLRQYILNNPNKHMSQWKADCLFSSSPSVFAHDSIHSLTLLTRVCIQVNFQFNKDSIHTAMTQCKKGSFTPVGQKNPFVSYRN